LCFTVLIYSPSKNEAYLDDLMRQDALYDEDIDDDEAGDDDDEQDDEGGTAGRMLAQLMAGGGGDPERGFVAEDDDLREEIMDYLRSTAFTASASTAATKKGIFCHLFRLLSDKWCIDRLFVEAVWCGSTQRRAGG
jgi:hypothetical protein